MQVEGIKMSQAAVKLNSAESYLPVKKEQQSQVNVAANSPENKVVEKEVSEKEVILAIEKANQTLQYYDTRAEFSIHEETRQIMIKIYKNDEVIREIPSEKILDMVAKMIELAGIFVDETA